jgi:hypothetical protein
MMPVGSGPRGPSAIIRHRQESTVNIIANDVWQKIQPELRKRCPRLTPVDLSECQQRIDLLVAKIQNRHWIDRVSARRTVLGLLLEAGVAVPA